MAVEPDYYEILEVHNRASPEVITKAYRTLAARYHPDLQPPEKKAWAEEKFKHLNRAYQVLSDPVERAQYDRRREASSAQAAAAHRPSAPPDGPSYRTEAPPRTSAPQHCYRHPDMPRAALCHECGKPICSACVTIAHGYPVCSECKRAPLVDRLADHFALRRSSGVVTDWPMAACTAFAALGVGSGVVALFFPAFLWLWPSDPAKAAIVGFTLASLCGAAAVLAAWPVLARGRWGRRTALLALTALSIAGVARVVAWSQTGHADLGEREFDAGAYWAAFCDLSAALVVPGDPIVEARVRRLLGKSLLQLANDAVATGSSRQRALSWLAVCRAKDMPSSQNDSRPAAPRVYSDYDMLLVEAFSRVSENTAASHRKELWGTAMQVLGVAPITAPRPDNGAQSQSSQAHTFHDGCESYVWAVCCLEMVDLSDSMLYRAVRAEAKGIDSTLGKGTTEEALGRLYNKAVGTDPSAYQAAADSALQFLHAHPPDGFSSDRWSRCSRVVQQAVAKEEAAARRAVETK